ncbi:transposase [Mycolicibacterium gilvum]|uniref:Transposase n=1 Tax=Mycolicibacterium gilvum TaxID=1804 RepID=A0A378SGV7_9MYCO|nr:transposase [Mycolicibacterium gilvum]
MLAAADLVTWAQLIGFRNHPALARAEIATFRYRILHVAARITRGARQVRLRIDATWRWAAQIATAWQHLRTAFG